MKISPAYRTALSYAASGKCQRCGKAAPASETLCSPCLRAHNAHTAALKQRHIDQGRCAWCGGENHSDARTCDDCRARYNRQRRRR